LRNIRYPETVSARDFFRPDALVFGQPVPTRRLQEETAMIWTSPVLVEICIGLEINGYLPAEF
jgi:hypothetical protein